MTKILRKTCSSLVKIISDGLNNFTQNKYSKLQKISAKNKRYFLQKSANMGSSTVQLHGVDLMDCCDQGWILWQWFLIIIFVFSFVFHTQVGIYYIDIYSKCVTYLYIFLLLHFILFCPKSIHLLTYMGIVEVASFLSQ